MQDNEEPLVFINYHLYNSLLHPRFSTEVLFDSTQLLVNQNQDLVLRVPRHFTNERFLYPEFSKGCVRASFEGFQSGDVHQQEIQRQVISVTDKVNKCVKKSYYTIEPLHVFEYFLDTFLIGIFQWLLPQFFKRELDRLDDITESFNNTNKPNIEMIPPRISGYLSVCLILKEI